ncbi:MAG: ImmA/IrrE family metallo-endopeptidase [Dehalococcoidia bacterium]
MDQLRGDLGLPIDQQVPPDKLAGLLGVELRSADDFVPRKQLEELEEIQRGAFSACTFQPSPERTVIVFNPLCSAKRTASDIAHELAHIILGHELSRLERLGSVTFFVCDPAQEEEAAWLAGCLLLPRALLLAELRKGRSAAEISDRHNLSEAMVQYRINVTGVRRQLGRRAALP